MKKLPIVLGINRTQDGSVALMQGSTAVCCVQKERFTRKRHHWGKLGDIPIYLDRIAELKQPLDLVVEGYSSDKEIINLEKYHAELKQFLKFKNTPDIVRISHHLSHAYSAFYPSPFSSASVMVIDSVGSPAHDFNEKWYSNEIPSMGLTSLEVASYYIAKSGKMECIAKQLWDGNKANSVGLGQFYHLLTQCLFPGEGNEGKVMGLAPFGNVNSLKLPPLIVKEGEVYHPDVWKEVFNNSARYRFFIDGSGFFQDCADLAAIGQKVFEDALLKVATWLQKKTGMRSLCYAGGCALNCVANGLLLKQTPFEEVFVPAAPHDGGTALGCAIYGLIDCLDYPCEFKWQSDYLGPAYHDKPDLKSFYHDKDLIVESVENPESLVRRMVDLLTKGNILALFQGRSEFGPRALGNRSILADPRYAVVNTWINQSIKGREWFRPVAPLVLEEDVGTIFETNIPSPFMQFAVPVKKEYHKIITAGTHFDGTARLQTVSKNDNNFLYELLNEFKNITGIPVLLNTSFNGRGETIVETIQEAIACFKKTTLHSLIIPPYIISKHESPKSPLALSSIYDVQTKRQDDKVSLIT